MNASIHLKMPTLGLLNDEPANARIPALDIEDGNGQGLLNGRLAMQPTLDEVALYEMYHPDEPWDSKHTERLIARVPDVLRRAGVGDAFDTEAPLKGLGNLRPGSLLMVAFVDVHVAEISPQVDKEVCTPR